MYLQKHVCQQKTTSLDPPTRCPQGRNETRLLTRLRLESAWIYVGPTVLTRYRSGGQIEATQTWGWESNPAGSGELCRKPPGASQGTWIDLHSSGKATMPGDIQGAIAKQHRVAKRDRPVLVNLKNLTMGVSSVKKLCCFLMTSNTLDDELLYTIEGSLTISQAVFPINICGIVSGINNECICREKVLGVVCWAFVHHPEGHRPAIRYVDP